MHPQSNSDTPDPRTDLARALLARVEEVEQQLRAIPVASDEKALKELRKTLEALAKRDEKFEERVTNRVDVVADRMETLAKTVSNTSAALASRDGEIVQLRRELDARAAHVDAAVDDLRRAHDPRALIELQRAVAALSSQKLPRGIEGRIDDLAAKLKLLAERVDTVSSTASTAAARLGGRDGELIALRETLDTDRARIGVELDGLRRAVDPAAMAELRHGLTELSGGLASLQRSGRQAQAELQGALETLGGRLDALDTSLATAVGRIGTGEQELSMLRGRLEDEAARQASSSDGLEQSLRALSSRVAAQEDLSSESAATVAERLSGLGERLAGVESRLDSVSSAVDAATRALGERDTGLEQLRHELGESKARVDGLVRDLMRALEDFPGDAIPELKARLDEVVGQVGALAGRVDRSEEHARAQVAEAQETLEAARRALDDEVGAVRSHTNEAVRFLERRLETAEQEHEALGNDVARVASLWEREQARAGELATRVESLAASLDTTAQALAARDAELERLRSELSESKAQIDERVGDLVQALEHAPRAGMPELEARLDQITGDVRDLTTRLARAAGDRELESLRSEIARQADDLAAAQEARDHGSAEVARLAALVEVERASLKGRLDTLAATMGDTSASRELEQQVAALATRFETERLAVQGQLDALVDALAAPLVAEGGTARTSALEARLADLTRRLDEMERSSAAVASAVSNATTLWPTALRSLEARLDAIAPRPPVSEHDSPADARRPEPSEPLDPEVDRLEDASTDRAPASVGAKDDP